MSERCEACGRDMQVGDFPWCPHGRASLSAHPDDVPGGFYAENGFSEPTWFPSHSAHQKALAARGLEIGAKWAGPNDKIMSNWAAGTVDLAGAEALVRKHYPTIATAEAVEEFPITVTNVRFERPD